MQPFVLTAAELRARAGVKWLGIDEDVLPASGADMDFAVAEPVQHAITRVVARHDYGYPLRTAGSRVEVAFAARMRERFGWVLDQSLVVTTDSLLQALTACLLAFARRGDGVVLHAPYFFPFADVVASAGRRLVPVPMVDDGSRLAVDPDALCAAVDEGCRVLIVCNPHNPSGRVLERAELAAIGQVAVDRDLVVISDEVHCDLVYPGTRHVPMASIDPEVAARTVTLNSASKGFNIAGLRCAVMHFGSNELLRRFRRFIPVHLLGAASIVSWDATVAAWREGQPWLDQVMELLAANRRRVAGWAAEQGIGHHTPEATYLAWLDCRRLALDGPAHDFFLRHARVALLDGAPFGAGGAGHVRLNFATSEAILAEILQRLTDALARARTGA